MAAQVSLSRVKTVLTTPPEIPADGPRLKTNLDTDLLKLIAIVSMLIDHTGTAFFPGAGPFRWAGRLAFPIFAYCLTVGLLYTRDIRQYLKRLAVFALISQPFYILAFHPYDWRAEWSNLNIYFTLFMSLLALAGVKERKWWLFLLSVVVLSVWNFDYSLSGVTMMLIFYLCRNRPAWGAALYVLYFLPALWSGDPMDPLSLTAGGLCMNWTVFALLDTPLIFLCTHSGLKLNKYFFYVFYPAHLLAIGLARLILHV